LTFDAIAVLSTVPTLSNIRCVVPCHCCPCLK